jgi:CRP-like cAMP-binding protein
MSFKLKEVVFRIRCTEPGCSFNYDMSVKENLMGATEADVDVEAWKIVKNQAYIKHDSLFGRNHPLRHPEIHKVSGRYDRFGDALAVSSTAFPLRPAVTVPTRQFKKGERIIRKGERATTVCEVVQGSARHARRPDIVYRPGATFGSAALLQHRNRMADIVAGEDGTAIAFYDLRTLTKTDPVKARALYNEAMEDIFRVIEYLEDYSEALELKVERMQSAKSLQKKGTPKVAAAKKGGATKAVRKKLKAAGKGKKSASKKKPVMKAKKALAAKSAKKSAVKKPAKKASKRK